MGGGVGGESMAGLGGGRMRVELGLRGGFGWGELGLTRVAWVTWGWLGWLGVGWVE